jgi:ferredoxin
MCPEITVHTETCRACGLCGQVCPNLITAKGHDGVMFVRPDRQIHCTQCGQCMAICPTESIQVEGLSYTEDLIPLPMVAPVADQFWSLIASRRAVRTYRREPVPRELLEQVVDAISFAPPSFPPVKIEAVVVQDPAAMRKALPIMIDQYDKVVQAVQNPIARRMIRRRVGPDKYQMLESHVVPLMEGRLPALRAGTEDTITRGAPAMILLHARQDAENRVADAYVALAFGLLAAHALGLGACPLDLVPPAVDRSPRLREMFKIPMNNVPIAAFILGYPRNPYRRAIRRRLRWVEWV